MKVLLKSIVPQPAINLRRKMQSRRGLGACRAMNLDTSFLPENIDSGACFSNKAIDHNWQRDHKAISGLVGENNRFDGVNPGDRQAIYKLISALQPQSILEISTHIGFSTLYMALAAKTYSDDFKLTTVDIIDVNAPHGPWSQCGLQDSPWSLAEDLNCAWNIQFVKKDAQNFLKSYDQKFDFIFLDGDHSARGVYNEIALAGKVLNNNGIILLHDYYPGANALFPDGSIIYGPYYAGERLKQENGDFDILPLGPLPWITKQNTYNTSLAIVKKKGA